MPANTRNSDGEKRRVGVEIEMQGIDVQTLATLLQETLGGNLEELTLSEYALHVPDQGKYGIEVDFALLKEMAKQHADEGEEIDANSLRRLGFEALDAVSSLLVPCEVVAPPLAMDALPEPMDAIVNAVRDAGANGTNKSVLYAFGVHLNVEPTDMQAATILTFMRAFVCLYEWIVEAGDIDLTRRITPYIDPFPDAYVDLLLSPDYQPDFPALIADYLTHNPTRNRALDMLPLFAFVDEETVMAGVEDDRVNARPTFHYRLANSCVDEPNWSIADPWSRWLKIEQLVADEEALSTLCSEFRENRSRLLSSMDNSWRNRVKAWIESQS